VAAAAFAIGARRKTAVTLRLDPPELPADGISIARIQVSPAGTPVEIVAGRHRARLEQNTLRAGVLPGEVLLRAGAAQAALRLTLDPTDSAGDGTPDYLRLDSDADRRAFRSWFTFLAETQAWQRGRTPPEINDCAALIRFAYREALRAHDGPWANALRLPLLPAMPSVEKYQYPYTPLGANLFLTDSGAFAEFADARTLRVRNTHFLTRDLRRARPGDLLFFRQPQQNMPFHAMVYVGPSHFTGPGAGWLVYHTGPSASSKGEIRRVTLDELLAHPMPQWRPLPGNPNFLGVYAWNILREVS